MNDVVQQILIGAAGDGSGGLAAEFVVALLRTAGKLVRERFGTPERTSALQRAVATAFTEALDAWTINIDETVHYCDLFKTWLLNPTVLSEFRSLLTPVDSGTLDSELLRAEFEDSGLSADYLGTISFDILLQDMVGAFYRAAAEEPALQEPIKIDLLRQMAQRMGALDRLMQRQTRAGEMAVDHLVEIRRLAQEQALRDMHHFAGLLAERGRDAFGFLHLTFQEYFAGRALARMDPEQRWAVMVPNLHRPRWREPILLCAGQLGVIEQRRDQVNALARRILEADSAHEDILHQDLFLLAALAADDVGLSPSLFDEITSRLALLQESGVPTVRDTALAGLALLTRLGHVQALARLKESLHKPHLQIPAMHAVKVVIEAEACTSLRPVILAYLDHANSNVRQAAVKALAGLIGSNDAITKRLLPWLGTVGEVIYWPSDTQTRRLLATTYAPLLMHQPDLLAQVAAMLTSPAWPMRQGAAWTLIAMPDGSPPHLRPALLGLLDDSRGEESWPERLQVCEILINARDRDLSQHAIALALEALDYATQPWYDLPHTGPHVRQYAARILGQLEPLYRDERIFTRLVRVLEDDTDADVRDAAYGALLRLAAAPEQEPQEVT